MELISKKISTEFVSQVRKTILPAISKKFEIELSDLLKLLDVPQLETPSDKNIPVPSLSVIRAKAISAHAQNKALNIESMRMLSDTVANRKKYKFIKTSQNWLLAATHENAFLEYLEKTFADETSGSSSNPVVDGNGTNVQETPIPPNTVKKEPVNMKNNKLCDDTISVKQIETYPDGIQPVEPDPPVMLTTTGKKINKILKKKGSITRKQKLKNSVGNTVDNITDTTIDNMFNNTDTKITDVSDPKSPKQDTQVREFNKKWLNAQYNAKLKSWWYPKLGFVVKRKGSKCTVVGKVEDGSTSIIELDSNDLDYCAKNDISLGAS